MTVIYNVNSINLQITRCVTCESFTRVKAAYIPTASSSRKIFSRESHEEKISGTTACNIIQTLLQNSKT